MKATKTINKLHFDDLSFSRFEDMCVQIVYRMDNWRTIQHFGRKGKEKGLDIFTEKDNNKIIEKWYIQCKRYKNISKSQIKIIIDELIEQNNEKPDKYLLILACDVSREVFEYYQKYASSTGIGCVDMITASTLETILYDQHPDILYTFFGINIMNKRIATVARIRRRLRMKQKFQNSFRGIERGRSIIIRDVHRDYVYPDSNPEIKGVYPWFKVEYKSLYHRGVLMRWRLRISFFLPMYARP